MATQDLWGELSLGENIRTPITILREQAALLGEKTQHVLQGDIRISHYGVRDFEAEFFIIVPALDNYAYRLFSIRYPVTMYPLTIIDTAMDLQSRIECPAEEDFVNALRLFLSQAKVKKIISSLIAQSKANN